MDEFLLVFFNQCLEVEQHPRPALGVACSPGGLRRFGGRDRLREDCRVPVLQNGLHLPGVWMVDRAGDGASACDALAVDEMADCAHAVSHPQWQI